MVLTLSMLVGFIYWLVRPTVLNSLVVCFLFECYFLNIFHARHHKSGAIYGIPFLDQLTSPLYDIIDRTWGYVPAAWHYNHNVRHHLHTNDLKEDPDLPDTHPLVRISEDQPKYWYNKFQTFYWPFLLPFSVIRFPLQNVVKHNGGMTMFLLWLTLMFGIPGALHGFFGLTCSLLLQGLIGILITTKFSVSHCHSELGRDAAGDETKCMDTWIKCQVEESMSWGGYLSCLIYGGIGYQIEHHLCPALEPPLYYFIQPELKRICEKHGIRFTTEPSFFHALYQFHLRLWRIG
jgi:fatty acid desaturase